MIDFDAIRKRATGVVHATAGGYNESGQTALDCLDLLKEVESRDVRIEQLKIALAKACDIASASAPAEQQDEVEAQRRVGQRIRT